MTKSKGLILAIAAVALIAAAVLYFYAGGHNAPSNQPPLADLTGQSIETFRADFNRASDLVRIVLLLSPT